jgi:uncharacterized membrane protein YeaQ/YmgE (transglycosylase-associated protein family)
MDLTDVSTLILGVVAGIVGLAAIPKSKARPVLVSCCLCLIAAAVGTGLAGSLTPSSPASTLSSPTTSPASRGQAYTPEPAIPPSQGVISGNQLPDSSSYAAASLKTSSGMQATAYFGQLASIVNALPDTSFSLDSDTISSDTHRCSLTVVVTHVPGISGAVYAQGLGPGWGAAEEKPSSAIADESLHQQIVTPPANSTAGTTWQGSAFVRSNSATATTQGYNLELQSVHGSEMTWAFDGHDVTCSE